MRSSKIWTIEEIKKTSEDLIGKKVGDVISKRNPNNKGGIGMAIETDVFNIKNNSSKDPDFKEAGIELKVIPLKTIKGKWVPKERLSLTMINFLEDYKYSFYDSHLYKKTKLMQIIQYNHDYINKYNSEIVNQFLYTFPKIDLEIIKKDYQDIMDKIKSGNAHNISEGDTLYLGACRKGQGKGKDLQQQPFSKTLAKSRAYSLKTSYLKLMNARRMETNESIFKYAELSKNNFSFEKTLKSKLHKYKGMDVEYLCTKFNVNKSSKQANETLVSKMLNLKGKMSKSNEFIKASMIPKTIRIINGKIKEHMSFSAIDFNEVKNAEWKNYKLKVKFDESKFVFLIFEGNSKKTLKFRGIKMWNMPKKDIKKYELIFNKLKTVSNNPNAVFHNGKNYEYNFPKPKESEIGHVRPKARNSKDTIILPNGEECPKQAFWLNKEYIKKIIE